MENGIHLKGLYQTLYDLGNRHNRIPWGIKAKEKNELLQPRKAPAMKKKRRKAVQASRRGNR